MGERATWGTQGWRAAPPQQLGHRSSIERLAETELESNSRFLGKRAKSLAQIRRDSGGEGAVIHPHSVKSVIPGNSPAKGAGLPAPCRMGRTKDTFCSHLRENSSLAHMLIRFVFPRTYLGGSNNPSSEFQHW